MRLTLEDANALVERHMRDAERIAAKLFFVVPGTTTLEDVKSDALLGLVAASRAYDPSRQVPFMAFAYRYIAGTVREEVRRGCRIKRYTHAAMVRRGEEIPPPDAELTDRELDIPDRTPDPLQQAHAAETRERLERALSALPEPRQYVMRALLQGRQKKEIAKHAGLCASRISQISRRATTELQAAICVALVLFLALAGTAQAQERPRALVPLYTGSIGLQVYDAYSTMHGVNRGAVEQNPLLRGVVNHQIAFVGLKANTAILTVYASERLWKAHHPRLAVASMIISNGLMSYVASRNATTLKRLR